MILVHHILVLNLIAKYKDLTPICFCSSIILICMLHIFCLENYEELSLKSLWALRQKYAGAEIDGLNKTYLGKVKFNHCNIPQGLIHPPATYTY